MACSIFLTSEALAKEVVLLEIDAVAPVQQANPQQQHQDNKAMNQVSRRPLVIHDRRRLP